MTQPKLQSRVAGQTRRVTQQKCAKTEGGGGDGTWVARGEPQGDEFEDHDTVHLSTKADWVKWVALQKYAPMGRVVGDLKHMQAGGEVL